MGSSAGTLNLGGYSPAVGSLAGQAGGVITNFSTSASTLTVNQSTANTYGGVIRDGSGTVALTMTGNNVLTLNGNNTYSGGTTISSGTLALGGGGSIAASANGISIAGVAAFNVSALSGYALNQTLSMTQTGTAYVAGGLVNASGVTLNLPGGTNLGAVDFTGNLTLGGGTLNLDLGSSASPTKS